MAATREPLTVGNVRRNLAKINKSVYATWIIYYVNDGHYVNACAKLSQRIKISVCILA